ncbi:unnamed protein product [Clavelina lepadiformis]|uniref:Uncharacterized protein n=1 Tax=Clavelina lepadiformis TaxID=159417 RepID=A0ABP0G7X4_CLALP
MAYGRGSNLEPLAPSAVSKDASYEAATANNDNLTDLKEHQILEKGKVSDRGFEPATHCTNRLSAVLELCNVAEHPPRVRRFKTLSMAEGRNVGTHGAMGKLENLHRQVAGSNQSPSEPRSGEPTTANPAQS